MKKAIGVTGLMMGWMFALTGFAQSADGPPLAKKLPAQSAAGTTKPVNEQKGVLATKLQGNRGGNETPGNTSAEQNRSVKLGSGVKPMKDSNNTK